MKKPQIEDFATSTRALDRYNIDNMPSIQPRTARVAERDDARDTSTYSPTRPSMIVQSSPEPERGGLRRHSYEVYGDQVKALNQLAHQDKMRGGKGSMSEMVREAIDTYVQQRLKKTE